MLFFFSRELEIVAVLIPRLVGIIVAGATRGMSVVTPVSLMSW